MMRWHDGWNAGAWIATGVVMVVFWTLVVAVLLAAVRGRHAPADMQPEPARVPGDAMQILDERLARGEIDVDEYTARRDLLQSR